MQTKPIDSLRLWWRDINFTATQRKALAITAVIALGISALYIFKPNQAEAIPTPPVIMKPALLIVDVAGEVVRPGVYELAPNSRVIDAVKAAGGAKSNADLSLLNLARVVKDGEQIYVEKKYFVSATKNVRTKSGSNVRSSGPINLNRASAKDLEALPGIGPVLAARILEYRRANGSFISIEDLSKVPGIGPSKLAKFKDLIRI